jgi:hypothetical protein
MFWFGRFVIFFWMKTSDGLKKFLGGQKFQICEEGFGTNFLDVFLHGFPRISQFKKWVFNHFQGFEWFACSHAFCKSSSSSSGSSSSPSSWFWLKVISIVGSVFGEDVVAVALRGKMVMKKIVPMIQPQWASCGNYLDNKTTTTNPHVLKSNWSKM